jgi:hypothetical protein
MTDARFNLLLQGPLYHPVVPLQITRLALALREVVERTGATGDEALEAVCREREASDRQEAQ